VVRLKLKLYEEHYHDLLNDLDKEVVMSDIQSWIESQLAALKTNRASAAKAAPEA